MTTIVAKTAEDDLLNDAQFDPIFDADGNLVDIVRLEISTDRSRGVRAMEELANSEAPGDHIVGADGWTGKWRRILNTPAPGAAHSIKRTKRWDTQTSDFVPSATLILPFEVVWTLFDRLFFGRYSVAVQEIVFDSEDVVESPTADARNLPGRVFYARAHVALTLHLENGQSRVYTGVGVAYDSVRAGMTGNIYAINSARRLAEKGAVSDAKREALATIGRVFTRAYEDGNEALRAIESKILEKIRRPANTSNVRTLALSQSAAPRKPTTNSAPKQSARPNDNTPVDTSPQDYIPLEAANDAKAHKNAAPKTNPAQNGKAPKAATGAKAERPAKDKTAAKAQPATNAAPKKAADTAQPAQPQAAAPKAAPSEGYLLRIGDGQQRFATPDDTFEAAFAAIEGAADARAQAAFLERNKVALLAAEQDSTDATLTYADLESLVADTEDTAPQADGIPDFEDTPANTALVLQPAKETGEAILEAYTKALTAPNADVDAILSANTHWAQKLTNRQKLKLAQTLASVKKD